MPGAMKTRCHTRAEGRKSSTRRQQDSPSSPANDDEKRAKKMRILKRFKLIAIIALTVLFFRVVVYIGELSMAWVRKSRAIAQNHEAFLDENGTLTTKVAPAVPYFLP
ncbi:unnamed protein product [Zymoseptoria tritici ST99CH_1A5]|uniref:Uncharacterized protein n=2 Tax=Zymoseptoria tritici TaxID=1047171 RepID=A0A2H1H9A6_ZYMTR|nr:unnamed protein product [Zymoseptoria tritici ST99CH_1E4]SMR64802.1 unnamed protein product [Zymoseptoria tritici ST99CH_3D1]SMY30195.1 unnamed protein product [Zymoseptoria tritici ST99CH_1A5]